MSEAKNSQPAKRRISIRDDLLRVPESPAEKPYLLGTKCLDCGETFTSRRYYCAVCTSARMKEVALSSKGKLETFTISRMTPPGSVMQAPYALGIIRLAEGAKVTAALTDVPLDSLHCEMDMEMVSEKVLEDSDGNDIISFKFRPV